MAHRIGVSDYCTAITSGSIIVIVSLTTAVESISPTTTAESMSQTIAVESMSPTTAAELMSPTTVLLESVTESMSPTTVLLESMTELMLSNQCLRSTVIFFFDPTVIIFIVISTGHNFEIQTVNSNLTLNPMVNSKINVIFF